VNAARWFSFSALLAWVGLALSVTVLVIATGLDPDERGFGTHEQLGLAPCAVLELTGKPCLSCGMTTSFAALMRGRVLDSVHANPAGCALCLLTLVAPFWCGHALWSGLDPLRFLARKSGRWLLVAVGGIAILTWVWRSLPLER
jgi:hypothetical protein